MLDIIANNNSIFSSDSITLTFLPPFSTMGVRNDDDDRGLMTFKIIPLFYKIEQKLEKQK